MKYKSNSGKDIILNGSIYVCGKDNIVDLPKEYDHPDLTVLSEKELKNLSKDKDNAKEIKPLDKMNLTELKELAKDIDGSNKMKKAELIEALTEK